MKDSDWSHPDVSDTAFCGLACFDADPGQDNDQEPGISGSDRAVRAISK